MEGGRLVEVSFSAQRIHAHINKTQTCTCGNVLTLENVYTKVACMATKLHVLTHANSERNGLQAC